MQHHALQHFALERYLDAFPKDKQAAMKEKMALHPALLTALLGGGIGLGTAALSGKKNKPWLRNALLGLAGGGALGYGVDAMTNGGLQGLIDKGYNSFMGTPKAAIKPPAKAPVDPADVSQVDPLVTPTKDLLPERFDMSPKNLNKLRSEGNQVTATPAEKSQVDPLVADTKDLLPERFDMSAKNLSKVKAEGNRVSQTPDEAKVVEKSVLASNFMKNAPYIKSTFGVDINDGASLEANKNHKDPAVREIVASALENLKSQGNVTDLTTERDFLGDVGDVTTGAGDAVGNAAATATEPVVKPFKELNTSLAQKSKAEEESKKLRQREAERLSNTLKPKAK